MHARHGAFGDANDVNASFEKGRKRHGTHINKLLPLLPLVRVTILIFFALYDDAVVKKYWQFEKWTIIRGFRKGVLINVTFAEYFKIKLKLKK